MNRVKDLKGWHQRYFCTKQKDVSVNCKTCIEIISLGGIVLSSNLFLSSAIPYVWITCELQFIWSVKFYLHCTSTAIKQRISDLAKHVVFVNIKVRRKINVFMYFLKKIINRWILSSVLYKNIKNHLVIVTRKYN